MTENVMGTVLTEVVSGVDGVERLYRPAGAAAVAGLSALATAASPRLGAAAEAVGVTATPAVAVSGGAPTAEGFEPLEVRASIGVAGDRPAHETLVATGDALLAALASAGIADADVTVRVSRIL